METVIYSKFYSLMGLPLVVTVYAHMKCAFSSNYAFRKQAREIILGEEGVGEKGWA